MVILNKMNVRNCNQYFVVGTGHSKKKEFRVEEKLVASYL
jgi:hypothetical protein